MSSRIEQIIEEIEEYIDRDCKYQPLSTTKIIVNKEHLDELLRELRMKTPDEIKRYQKIIANRDAILADAQAKANAMIEEAQVQTTERYRGRQCDPDRSDPVHGRPARQRREHYRSHTGQLHNQV